MAWDEFFIMYEEFQNNFWKFYKKFPHQPNFLSPLAQNFGVFGLWCTTATICKLKHPLGVWALTTHSLKQFWTELSDKFKSYEQ